MTLEQRALVFATRAHAGQVRKYTGEAYIAHPIAVAGIVKSVTDNEDMIAAALLHDTVEDCDVEVSDITREFGAAVSALVCQLTDVSRPEDGNRAARKTIDRDWLYCACGMAQTIKLADLIHNSQSILAADKGFARIYMAEKRELLDVLHGGDFTLHARATMIVEKYYISGEGDEQL